LPLDATCGLYVDTNFEAMLREVNRRIERLQVAVERKGAAECNEQFNAVCRKIRDVKLEFPKVLACYRDEYKDNYDHCLELAEHAAELAVAAPHEDVKKSLARHASELREMRDRFYDQAASN